MKVLFQLVPPAPRMDDWHPALPAHHSSGLSPSRVALLLWKKKGGGSLHGLWGLNRLAAPATGIFITRAQHSQQMCFAPPVEPYSVFYSDQFIKLQKEWEV